MLAKVLGTRKLDFKTSDGTEIKGTYVFVAYASEHVEGEQADKIFIPKDKEDILPVFKFGETYDFVQEIKGLGKNAKTELVEIRTKDGKTVSGKFPF